LLNSWSSARPSLVLSESLYSPRQSLGWRLSRTVCRASRLTMALSGSGWLVDCFKLYSGESNVGQEKEKEKEKEEKKS